jgi:endogenous inhibitor of DNA gyrase (YacG/DUF329 family)
MNQPATIERKDDILTDGNTSRLLQCRVSPLKQRKLGKFVCKQCGKEFEQRADNKPVFCSRKCSAISRDHSVVGGKLNAWAYANIPGYGKSLTPRICQTCGKSFVQKYRHNPKYCSRACLPQSIFIGSPDRKNDFEVKRKAAYESSPRTKALTETRHNAKRWHLRSPSNIEYHPKNLNRFVALNPNLFEPQDLLPIYKDGRCRAASSLKNLRPTDTKKKQTASWKGWTWISIVEKRWNDGDDLLERSNERAMP